MRKNLLHCVMAAALLSATACQTTRPPHVPQPPKGALVNDPAAEIRAAVGTITVSTPTAKALVYEPDGNDRLDFGDAKSEANLRMDIRNANMSRSIMQYEALKAALAVNVAGTQVSSSSSTETSGGVGGSVDFAKLITALLAPPSGTSGTAIAPSDIASLKADFSAKASASHKESFDSPKVPETPTTSSTPQSVLDKLLSSLGPGTGSFHLDPTQEARLIASCKTYMTALEDFYNADNVANYIVPEGKSQENWHPYRMVFSVSVDPGWYPLLKQDDAIVDLDFARPGDESANMRVLNVMPAETAQNVDELTASLSELASALTVAGGFKAIAASGKVEYLNALAQRLEGARKQTNVIVSYPDQKTVRIRIRPSMVASLNLAETQPTNIVFAATVLVQGSSQKEEPPISDEMAKKIQDAAKRVADAIANSKSEKRGLQEKAQEFRCLASEDFTKVENIQQLDSKLTDLRNLDCKDEAVRDAAEKAGDLTNQVSSTNRLAKISTTEASVQTMSYKARFEQQTVLKRKGCFPWTSAPHLFGPVQTERDVLPAMFAADGSPKDCVDLSVFVPNWPPTAPKLGFTKDPAGFYDCAGKNITGYICYSVNGTKKEDGTVEPAITLFVDDNKDGFPITNQEALQGVLKVDIPANGASGDVIRVFLRATDAKGNTEVRVATLLPRAQQEPQSPSVSINANGVTAEGVPLPPTTPELLKALIPTPEAKPSTPKN